MLHGRRLDLMGLRRGKKIHFSLSRTVEHATAMAVLEGQLLRPATWGRRILQGASYS